MKVTIFSDCHCGFEFGSERGEDPFEALEEVMRRASDSDLIIIAGDLFDSRVPKQEVFAKTAKILSAAKKGGTGARLVRIEGKDEVPDLALRGIPVVVIHGTHERRSIHMVNPVQALEHAGLVLHLHLATAVFEIGGRLVAVHGMSGVPERYAADVLREWSPKPVEGAVNIFVFHQSVREFIYSPLDPPSISIEDLPDGFDLYVLGHLHWREVRPVKSGKLVLTGSLVSTTAHRRESEQEKGFYTFDGSELEFHPLENQRRVYHLSAEYSADLESRIDRLLSSVPESGKKPVVYLKIKGTVPKGSEVPDLSRLPQKYSSRMILKIIQNLEEEEEGRTPVALQHEKASPEEYGMAVLKRNLEAAGCRLGIDEIFDFLVEGNVDAVFDMLAGDGNDK